MRSALDVYNGLYPAIVPDWSNATLSSQDTVRDRHGLVALLAEVFGVREASGGEFTARCPRRAHRQAGFGYRIRAWPSASGSHSGASQSEGPRDPLKDAGEAGIARPTSGVAGSRGAVGGPEDGEGWGRSDVGRTAPVGARRR